jgi:hypothetical protein
MIVSNRMALLSCLFLISVSLFLAPRVVNATIGSSKMTLYAVADAYVNSSNPNANYGNENSLKVVSDGQVSYIYVMFDLSSVPSDANILSAEIMLYLQGSSGTADTIGVFFCVDNSWRELEITYNNKPGFNPIPTDTWSFGFIEYYDYKSWNVTQDVKTAFPSGRLTEVLKFTTKTGSGSADFDSRETPNKPGLEIEYATKQVCSVHLESALDTEENTNSGSMILANETLPLPSDVNVVVGSYQINYIGGYYFLRWETNGGVYVSDPNAQNTTVNISGNGTLMAVGNTKRIEYAYYAGNQYQSKSERLGHICAVRFTPIRSGQLMTARFYLAATQWINDSLILSDNTFKFHFMDADRNDIIPPFTQSPAVGYYWFDVDLTDHGLNVTSNVDFYLGIEWTLDNHPEIGETLAGSLGNHTSRSWIWDGTAWTLEENYDFMIRAVVGTLVDHRIADGYNFRVTTESNSTISNFKFIQAEKKILFNVTGPLGTTGFCNVTIPKPLLQGDFNVMLDGGNITDFIVQDNATHTSLYLTYGHSVHSIEITGTIVIPEPTALLFTLSMAITGTAVIVRKKRPRARACLCRSGKKCTYIHR